MKLPLCLAAIFFFHLCSAQEKITYLSEDGTIVNEKGAAILQQTLKVNDTLWEFNFYDMYGPRSISLQCRDEKGAILNGRYITYSQGGYYDTLGYYSNGAREGNWKAGGQQLTYAHGELIEKKDLTQVRRDSTSGKEPLIEIEAAYPGGPSSWLRYLSQHLHYPKRAEKKEIQGTIVVDFLVENNGHIDPNNIYISRSAEYSLDQEAIRLIRESRLWVPAISEGKQARSHKRQPLIFKLSVQESPPSHR
jgi:TonB family protein